MLTPNIRASVLLAYLLDKARLLSGSTLASCVCRLSTFHQGAHLTPQQAVSRGLAWVLSSRQAEADLGSDFGTTLCTAQLEAATGSLQATRNTNSLLRMRTRVTLYHTTQK